MLCFLEVPSSVVSVAAVVVEGDEEDVSSIPSSKLKK
jgi:hypothetical protein